jgi:DNA mismatch repair protein MutS2
MSIDLQTLDTLEFGALLQLIVRHAQTPLGHRRILALHPMIESNSIGRALDLTGECVAFHNSGERFGLSGIEDPESSLARLTIEGTSLEPKQVLGLERLVAVAMGLRELFRDPARRQNYPILAEVGSRIPDLRRLLSEIKGKVLPGGDIDDRASPELRAIRNEIQQSRQRIHRSLEGIMQRQSRAVQEELITFRNGRFVIPVRTDSRVSIPGVVHGLSSSGQTTYMEPLSVIDQNNELVRLQEQETAEIARILLAITDAFRAHIVDLQVITDVLGEFDLGQAKARLAIEAGCVRPQISSTRELRLIDGRHILLDHALRQTGDGAVPISFAFENNRRVMVISGPNAGGKTVVLKTVGLLSLMMQTGLHIPATEAVLPIFDRIIADIGDQQSISANLSTFTAHMRNIAEMANRVTPTALLLLDEVGTGTDPDEGAALAVAIVDHFRRAGATTLVSTHYNPLKMWASEAPGVLNASVEFDEKTLRPTYRLLPGIAGSSSGLEIARRMGMPEILLESARLRYDPGHARASEYLKTLKAQMDEQESLRAELAEERAAAAEQSLRLEAGFAARELERSKELAAALERAGREFQKQSELLIQGLGDRILAEKMRKTAQNRGAQLQRAGQAIVRKIQSEIGLPPEDGSPGSPPADPGLQLSEPIEGDKVWVKPIDQAGIVDSIQGELYSVAVGSLKFRARLEDLQLLEAAAARSAKQKPPMTASDLNLERPFVPELKVIGMTAEEALDRVDRFLDEALLAGAETVRIIHGHGKGILRRAISEFLKEHAQVEKFQLAPPNQGGGGATIAELKK